jgi:hypothetical protein
MDVIRHDAKTEDLPGVSVELSDLLSHEFGDVRVLELGAFVVRARSEKCDHTGLCIYPWIESDPGSSSWRLRHTTMLAGCREALLGRA